MRKFQFAVWLTLLSIAPSTRSTQRQYELPASVDRIGSRNIFPYPKIPGNGRNKTPMHKAIFTQRGYIQFLRWELPVPEIEEFTFCLWLKSVNLTHSHSIFSYSRNETQRLVRSWISPLGRSVHLEIGGIELLEHPTRLEEHRWYHICQSWDNRVGHYALWINGRKEVEGYSIRLVGHVIPKGGDIVVGQEYTDFDKGLEEGIEGAVVGFNLLLVSAFDRSKYPGVPIEQSRQNFPRILSANEGIPREFPRLGGPPPRLELGVELHRGIPVRRGDGNGVRFAPYFEEHRRPMKKPANNFRLEYPTKIFNGRREGTFESTLKEYLGGQELFGRNLQRRSDGQRRVVSLKIVHKSKRDLTSRSEVSEGESRLKEIRRTTRSVERIRRGVGRAPLGLQLIGLTYAHCQIGRGSPFIGGSKMLISWTRTPVKVFGGAILKNVRSDCGNF